MLLGPVRKLRLGGQSSSSVVPSAAWHAVLLCRTAIPKSAFASAAAAPAQAAAPEEPAADVHALREQCRGVLVRLQSREAKMSKLER